LISAWIDLYDQNHGKLLDALEEEEGYVVIKTTRINETERKNYWRNIGIISNISLMILSLIMIQLTSEKWKFEIYSLKYIPIRKFL
jgi:hypothetical protein